ncbi:response regulator transcription factor [Cyclobacteriaceae bacterium]|nr:response regulator transcription factor [Cyclobacteriaceae bacterium]
MIRILIADDDPDILEMVEYNLSKEGFDVVCAHDGQQALDLIMETKPQLAILDIMMPEKDGVEVCSTIRQDPKYNDMMILFLTARSEDYTQIACYESGGDDYIVKPIKPRVLVSRIKGILRRFSNENSAQKPIQVKDVSIDLEKHAVLKGNKEINLAKKEFELLLLLSSRPGKLFTRDEIFNKIWGIDQVIGDRTIDVHIRKLREKLGNHYIKTIKGIGYKVEV